MGLFDVFTFKKDLGQVFTNDNFKAILNCAKDAIIGEIKDNIPGQEKKDIVDAIVLSKLDSIIEKASVKNGLVLWAITLIENAIPSITQLVYDFLKEKIENL